MNILVTKRIIMNLSQRLIIINSCKNIKIFLIIIIKLANQISQIILVKQYTVVLSQSNLTVMIIQLKLSLNCDFLFKSDCHQAETSVYIYIVNHAIMKVYVWNNDNVSLIISWKFCIKHIIKYKVNSCYLTFIENIILVSTSHHQSMHWKWIQTIMQNILITAAAFHTSMNEIMKQKLFNKIIIYNVSDASVQIKIIINDYLHLWKDHSNVVDVFKRKWMNISLLKDWQKKYKLKQI